MSRAEKGGRFFALERGVEGQKAVKGKKGGRQEWGGAALPVIS